MRTEFHYCFQITRKIIFNVSYYTLGSNSSPYFATSADEFNQPKTDFSRCGQCQNDLLTGKALRFYKKWDHCHLHDLTDEEYDGIRAYIEELKAAYNYIVKEKQTFANTSSGFSFYEEKELSKQNLKRRIA